MSDNYTDQETHYVKTESQGTYQQEPEQPTLQPESNLVWAVLVSLFCCNPLGIVAVAYAAQVDILWHAGQLAASVEAAARARKFAMWATIIGIVFWVGYGLIVACFGLSLTSLTGNHTY